MLNTLPTLLKPTDTLLDYLNLQIKYFKRVDILTYYTPSDPNKDKEPKLNWRLQKEWLPAKTFAHKQQLAKESEIMARKTILEGPEERAKTRKKRPENSEGYEEVPITFYTCNTSHITNKMPILAHDVGKHKFDVVHITEAGLLKKEPTGMTGYKSVKLVRKEPNRGSVIWVRADYMDRMVRVYAPNEDAKLYSYKWTLYPRQIYSECTKRQENPPKRRQMHTNP